MHHAFSRILILILAGGALAAPARDDTRRVAPQTQCADPECRDQDDMAIWVHPTDPARSTIIASDKKASKVFVYDLNGKTLQSLPGSKPGNIDVRYGFRLGDRSLDIVALNQRVDTKILVYRVDPNTRLLERIDNDAIRTAENYGGTLFRSPRTGKFYFLTTAKESDIEQYELTDDGAGRIAGRRVRHWRIGKAESAVADDEAGVIYIGEEEKGVWKVGGEPDDPAPGELVIRRGENGLSGDVEGLAIYHLPGGAGYLIVSNQVNSDFKVYERSDRHRFVGTFAIEGAERTDGIDVCNADLGPRFPNGVFACHTDVGHCAVLLTRWDNVAKSLTPSLRFDTTWNRRR